MNATQTIAWFVISAGTAVAGATGYVAFTGTLPFGLSTSETSPAVEAREAVLTPVAPAPPVAAPDAVDNSAPSFDVVRIQPGGVSVLAGRAPPNSVVSVLANGQPVATAQAQSDGNWSLATEKNFEPGKLELSLTAQEHDGGAKMQGQAIAMSVSGPTVAASAPPVEKSSTPRSSFPVPVKFVYGEAAFTDEGETAAAKLAEFIRQRRLETVTLSGHADERGSDSYNMDLSRRRLQAIAQYLRDHGFAGKLVLEPKGKSEPFTGINRSSLPKEAVYAFDRRVELHLTQ
jgi:outer membrane protein OmpA-like peptidoglycan-associated protein